MLSLYDCATTSCGPGFSNVLIPLPSSVTYFHRHTWDLIHINSCILAMGSVSSAPSPAYHHFSFLLSSNPFQAPSPWDGQVLVFLHTQCLSTLTPLLGSVLAFLKTPPSLPLYSLLVISGHPGPWEIAPMAGFHPDGANGCFSLWPPLCLWAGFFSPLLCSLPIFMLTGSAISYL